MTLTPSLGHKQVVQPDGAFGQGQLKMPEAKSVPLSTQLLTGLQSTDGFVVPGQADGVPA
ncbi:hypothetical protein E6H34_02640 [Candidatus Bathyarchaeota archaeon]|nr:MAG: hypothetical protein E6H34_02640 [Candidatus Bathyarchaeota archaeon]